MTTLNTIIEEEKEAQKTNEEIVEEFLSKADADRFDWSYKEAVEFLKSKADTHLFDKEVYPEPMLDISCERVADWLRTILTLKDEAHKKEMEEAYQRGFELGMNTAEEQHTGRVIPDLPTKEVTEELPTNH